MATLLLRLAGPLQSWGEESKFETRRTMDMPTKSGVIGMLAAAMGLPRDASLERLSALRFGVRVDKEGELLRDFHIAKGRKDKDAYRTYRFYLADAVFLAGLESEDGAFLDEIAAALRAPAFPLFLGRRACPPTMPLLLGVRDTDLLTALREEPWLLPAWRQHREDAQLRIVTDCAPGEQGTLLRDVPLSFSPVHREHTWRAVRDHGYVKAVPTITETEHDAFAGWE